MDKTNTLVLTRKTHEEIIITAPDGTRVTVGVGQVQPKRNGNSQCRLYIVATSDVTVNRKEIQDKIDNEQTA